MRKLMVAGLFIILCTGLLSGCSQQTDVETSTVFIEKKGSVVSVDVEKFDKEYYEAEELENYIEKQVEEYGGKDGGVEKSSFDVKDGKAKLKMRYDSYEDYANFNGIEFYSGSVVTAQAEGYDFDTEFYSVSENLKEQKAVDSETELWYNNLRLRKEVVIILMSENILSLKRYRSLWSLLLWYNNLNSGKRENLFAKNIRKEQNDELQY